MKSRAIVTLADSNYFDLLLELIASIKRFEQSNDVSICVLDAGLKEDQIKNLNGKVEIIKKAKWDIEVPSYKTLGKEWLKSQVSRAFLPEYFPDFEKYLWIDCDAWVNTWECVDLYFKAFFKFFCQITQHGESLTREKTPMFKCGAKAIFLATLSGNPDFFACL